MSTKVIVAFLLGLLRGSAIASTVNATNRPFVIRNVRIFDGARVIAADSVVVADGKIAAVGTNLPAPRDAEIIDGTGDTLLPGLIDSHVHAWVREVLEMGIVMGVTTELDMYMRREDAQRWKKEESQGAFDIADFRTAGTCFAVAGGHGTESTLPPITPIRTPKEAQALVDERIAQGSDYIKIMYDNGPRFSAMPKEVLLAIVNAAHKRHKIVIVHVFSPKGILDVIDSGAEGLAHVPAVKLPEPRFQKSLRDHHVFAITTLGFTDFFFGPGRLATALPEDPAIAPYLGPLWRRALKQPAWNSPEHISYADNEAALRTLRDAGVPLLAGTDASNSMPAGVLLHTELELMVNAGLTPLETLADATSVPAKIFSLMDRGRISAGLRADLLLVRGDPTRDVRATRDIVAIWKQGVHIDRDRFREAVAQENEAWQFGAGWMPLPASGSSVRISTITGGPNHARATMIISGEAKSEKMSTSVGAEYFPSLSYPMANEDVSGRPQVSFWTRGDGKTYRIALLQRGRTPSTRSFVASKEWTQIVIPFSDFGNDGSRVALVQISSSTRGPLHIELADALVGARRWLGIELAGGQEGVRVDSVNTNSPAQRAGMRAGDVITDFNGRRVHNYKDVLNLLSETRIGDKVRLDIERDDKRQTVVIEVAERRE